MQLGFKFAFAHLYTRSGLERLDEAFLQALKAEALGVYNVLMQARAAPEAVEDAAYSRLLFDLAAPFEAFMAELFPIDAPLAALQERHHRLAPLMRAKRLFVQRKAAKVEPAEDGAAILARLVLPREAEDAFLAPILQEELAFARLALATSQEDAAPSQMQDALAYAAWALHTPEGQARHQGGILFHLPKKTVAHALVEVETELCHGVRMFKAPPAQLRERHGFGLNDDGVSLALALDNAHYCIWCHHQGKDSCSKGLRERTGEFKTSAQDVTQSGCPLEEKISEMHELKARGQPLAALGVIVIDNPMCAGTGHRICNDCMKSCIYQKQEPVNIPAAETRTLQDVLELPYGVEIYALLTRWNPLNIHRPLPRPATGKRVLVAGMGPAGYTLAHHLLNDGHTVVGIDGLKIEPLLPEWSGRNDQGEAVPFKPIARISKLHSPLHTRTPGGFGGVAEYGITVRWDKNYLTLLRLLLERSDRFLLLGGVRIGGTISIETAWEMGFDHIALCLGAGKPTLLNIPNGLARGVRTASDFLMALHLSRPDQPSSIANLQVRLPILVIGGGLTAIDTATEALNYYPLQVEKFLARYDILAARDGEAAIRRDWSEEETIIAEEFLAHGRALRFERAKPAPNPRALLRAWGGATIAYRRRLTDAPSYRLNHEEVTKGLEEDVRFLDMAEPLAVTLDAYGHAHSVQMRLKPHVGEMTQEVSLPARTVLIAAGTSPNTVLQREEPARLHLHGRYFRALGNAGETLTPERSAKPARADILAAEEPDGRRISFFGDLHPSFAGNVVRAMGSAKQGYPHITRWLAERPPAPAPAPTPAFLARLHRLATARVRRVEHLTPNIVELVLEAPLAARAFHPGQFYRLQNFAARAPRAGETLLAMEGLAMTGAWVDKAAGLVAVIALEMGGSSDIIRHLRPGEPVALMGPTGSPTEIPANSTVLLMGGGLGNAVLFSIGQALRKAGSRVLYFAGYKKAIDRYKADAIEQASDAVVWCCDEPAPFPLTRPQDKFFYGTIIDAVAAYGSGALGETAIPLPDVRHLIVIGSDGMMAAVKAARQSTLAPYLPRLENAVGSINSPMQCMMKEICGQCLQRHIDAETGAESFVYSCLNQDQPLNKVCFPFLRARLQQNSVQEKLTRRWIERALGSE